MATHEDIVFSPEEMRRYDRHFKLPGFGKTGQQKLKAAKVLVIGAGGLGSPLLLYLAAAGVGTIGIVEADVVDESNLQRQVLYGQQDCGDPKSEAARKHLLALNPHLNIRLHPARLTSENALEIIHDYDVVADGSDNFPTRYLANDACVLADKPLVYAAVSQFEGQVSVFHYRRKDGEHGPNYRDLFPTPPPPGSVPDCAEGGVLGVLPGIIGSMQALEVIKIITGIGQPLDGRLFIFDALGFETRRFNIRRRDDNPLNGKQPTITQLIDYELFCGVSQRPVKEISARELQEWQQSGAPFQLIDVREPHEYAESSMGGELMPLGSIADHANRISREMKVVVHCRSGVRSMQAVRELEDLFGLENLYSLQGGLLAFRAEFPDLL